MSREQAGAEGEGAFDAGASSPGAPLAVVSDDPGLGAQLGRLLPDLLVEQLAAGDALVERVRCGRFGLVLLGAGARVADDLALVTRIKRSGAGRATPIVLRVREALPEATREGWGAGADDVVGVELATELLALRLRMLLRLCEAQRHQRRAARLDQLMREHVEALACERGLSAREREVLRLLVLGRTSQDIGVALGITARTAKFHQSNVLAKLGAESKFDLVRLLF